MKMATKVGMYLATHESVTVARGQRKENTDRVKNQSDRRIRYRAFQKKIKEGIINVFIKTVLPWFSNIYNDRQWISYFTHIYFQPFLLNHKQKW